VEIPPQAYRGPIDFQWWKQMDNPTNAMMRVEDAEGVAEVKKEFANMITKGKYKLTKELYTKFVGESMSNLLRKPAIELDDDYEFFYDRKATYDIHAEPRMIGGKYGCA